MTAGSFGLRASKISVTRGRPPVMSCVPDTSRGVLANSVPAEICVAFVDFDVGLFRQVVEVENLAAGVFHDDLRVQIALVLHDQRADVTAGVLFEPHRFAFDHVFVANLSADFGQNRDAVRIPLAEHGAGGDFLVLLHHQVGAGGNLVLFQLAALGVEHRDFAVSGQHDLLPWSLRTTFSRVNLTMPAFLARISLSSTCRERGAADVERPHRQLRARFADALGGDDAHRHALFDQRAGRKVHAVAAAADAQRRRRRSSGCGPGSFPGPALRCGGRFRCVIISFSADDRSRR